MWGSLGTLHEDVVLCIVCFAFSISFNSSRSVRCIPNPLAPGSRMKGHIHPIIKYIWWERERRLAVNDIFMDGRNSGCICPYLNKHYKFRWRQLFSSSNKKWNELWGGFNAQHVWCRLIGICLGHRDGEEGGILEWYYSLADFAPFSPPDVHRHHRRLSGLEQNVLGSIAKGVALNLQEEKKNGIGKNIILITA